MEVEERKVGGEEGRRRGRRRGRKSEGRGEEEKGVNL